MHLPYCEICWNAEASIVLSCSYFAYSSLFFLYAKHTHSPLLFNVVSLPITGAAKYVEEQLLISPKLPIRSGS